ncbi:PAS domain S-box protein [Bacillus sp. 165]|uniref:PAS domain S-box protein n=1 Tax=Bacillus sp. 165 TaxID=1529117 RepID=UPI001ADC00EA|nr:PAS domain S-box protein [Bacillus sp. 165]MBO9131163.1 PAS domain S-box protein [Bacillus sp. 165]
MSKRGIVTIYILFSAVWLYITDLVLNIWIDSVTTLLTVQTIKGTLYIIITSCLLYYVLTKQDEYKTVKQEEEHLSTLINSMVDFVNFKDGEGRWIEANKFGLKLFQLESIPYKGKTDSELAQYTPFYRDALLYCEESDERTWKAGKITRCEETILTQTNEMKTFDTIKVPLFYEDGSRKGLVVIGRDISKRKIAEQKLCESEQRYKSLFEYNPDLVYMLDLKGNITNLNSQFEVFTGHKREKYIGRSIFEFIPEEHKQRLKQSFYAVINSASGVNNAEFKFERKNGQKIILNCTSVPMIINNQVVGIIGYSKDITKIKETEERLRRTEKLSVAGELAAGVAHEIRNPLTALKGFVQLLQTSNPVHKHYYDIMSKELDRINHIVGELLVLAKPQEITFQKGNVVEIMNDVIALLESQANFCGITIDITVQDSIPLLDCEKNQLKQLFINIIKNSIEASSTKINILLAHKNDDVLIIIEDNGCGIPEERIKHLGEPFFTYKEKGTGLGLTVSYRILESHQGQIKFDSTVQKGTTVEITLPVIKKQQIVF